MSEAVKNVDRLPEIYSIGVFQNVHDDRAHALGKIGRELVVNGKAVLHVKLQMPVDGNIEHATKAVRKSLDLVLLNAFPYQRTECVTPCGDRKEWMAQSSLDSEKLMDPKHFLEMFSDFTAICGSMDEENDLHIHNLYTEEDLQLACHAVRAKIVSEYVYSNRIRILRANKNRRCLNGQAGELIILALMRKLLISNSTIAEIYSGHTQSEVHLDHTFSLKFAYYNSYGSIIRKRSKDGCAEFSNENDLCVLLGGSHLLMLDSTLHSKKPNCPSDSDILVGALDEYLQSHDAPFSGATKIHIVLTHAKSFLSENKEGHLVCGIPFMEAALQIAEKLANRI